MEPHGFSSIVNALPLGQKRHNASDITRAGEAEMISISSLRAVAAATGRGFKSHQPDEITSRREMFYCYVLLQQENRAMMCWLLREFA
jgi:hypothetical protein